MHAIRTQREVAKIMGISHQLVDKLERRALQKLRGKPEIRQAAEECGIDLDEVFEHTEEKT